MNVYIRNLCLELEKLGVATDVYTCSHADDEPCNFNGATGRTRLVHINAGHSEHGQTDYALSLAQAIDSYCRERNLRYDVVHSHYWLSGLAGGYLKDMWRIPHITMFHTLGALKNGALPESQEPESRITNESSVIHSCDRVIASTSIEKREIVTRYGMNADAISVIPCGVSPVLFRPIHKQMARAACGLSEKKTLLFVGRPDPIKGLDNLLQAISLPRADDDLQAVVTGYGNCRTGDTGQSAVQGDEAIRKRVIYTGPVDHEKMYLYYNAADLCIIPSYYESFCLTALESVSCGTPVLATGVGEIPEISRLSDLCKIMPDNRPETLAAYIYESLENNVADVPRPGAGLLTKYGWDSIAARVMHEYYSVLKAPVEVA